MKHTELLKRCHDVLRGVSIHTPSGVVKPAVDELAKEIADYLNQQHTHAHNCWFWGPELYECAYARIKRLQKEIDELND